MIKIKKYGFEFFLFLLILISRLPFVSKILYSWDAIQLSLAFKHFDLAQHQPHPPGYILYVGLGKIFNFIFHNANSAYLTISIIVSILTVIIFYNFLKLLFNNQKFSFLISLLLIFNPYFWFYGEVASTYIFDALFSISFAYLTLLIIKEKKPVYLYFFTFFLAISGGFRQSLLFLFFPLWVFALIILLKNKKINYKQILINIVLGVFSLLIWFLPLIYLSGGWTAYWRATNWQLSHASQETSIFSGVAWRNIFISFRHIIKITLVILNICLFIPLLLFGTKKIINIKKNFTGQIFYLFLIWLSPSYFVYIFIHFGNSGYLMTSALGLLIIFCAPLYVFFQNNAFSKKNIYSLLIIINIFSFLFIDSQFVKQNSHLNFLHSEYTYQNILNFDQKIKLFTKKIKEYDPQKTILITENGFQYQPINSEKWLPSTYKYFRHIEYYLPEYNLYEIFWSDPLRYFHIKDYSSLKINYSNQIKISADIDKIIIISDNIDQRFIEQSLIQKIKLNEDTNLFLIDFNNKKEIEYYKYKFIKD